MNETGKKTFNPGDPVYNPETPSVEALRLEKVRENLRLAVNEAFKADDTEKQERTSVLIDKDKIVEFTKNNELANYDETLGTRIWKILTDNAGKHAGSFQNDIGRTDKGEISSIELTDRLLEASALFGGIGDMLHSILVAYFKAELDKQPKKSDGGK